MYTRTVRLVVVVAVVILELTSKLVPSDMCRASRGGPVILGVAKKPRIIWLALKMHARVRVRARPSRVPPSTRSS